MPKTSHRQRTADTFTLDFVELTFGNIANTSTIGDGITITLNDDSSGSTREAHYARWRTQTTFSSSGAHNFYAPTEDISSLCPLPGRTQYRLPPSYREKEQLYRRSHHHPQFPKKHRLERSADGWTIPNEAQEYSSSTWTDRVPGSPMLIDVRARPNFELAELTETEVPFGWGLTPEGISRRPEVPPHVPHRASEKPTFHGHQHLQRVCPSPGGRRPRRHPRPRQPVPGSGQHGRR